MRRLTRVSRRFPVVRLALLALVLGVAIPPASTSAQYYDVHSNAPFEQLTGLQYAGQRLYQGEVELNVYIDVAVFDTSENAAAGLETLNAYYLDSYATAGSPIPFEPVDPPASIPDALAYLGYLDIGNGPYAEIVLVQVQDGTTVFSAFVSNYAYDSNPVERAMGVAEAMLGAILAVPAATATPAAIDPVSIMARLPLETDEVPSSYELTYSEDTDWYLPEAAAEPTAEMEVDASELLYGDAEGLVTVIARTYDDPNAGSSNAYIEVAEFDSDDHAAAGYAYAEQSLVEEVDTNDLAIEDIDVDVSADSVRAWSGVIEDVESTMIVIIAQSDTYVVAIVAYAADDDAARDLGEALAQATIDADAGDGEVGFDDSGFLSGGLWDKMPVAGDDALHGLEPTYDDEIYP